MPPPPARTITVALDMSNAFDTINIHTLIRKLLQTNIPDTILSSLQTTSRDAKSTQHIETTHPDNVNLKLAFHKVASFHPRYLTFTPHTYHHPVHRYRSRPMQMTSPWHPYTHIYNHTYIKKNSWTKQSHTKSRQNNCTLFTPDPAEYMSNLDLKIHNNALPMARHPKVLCLTLDPKLTYRTHIDNTHTNLYKS